MTSGRPASRLCRYGTIQLLIENVWPTMYAKNKYDNIYDHVTCIGTFLSLYYIVTYIT